MNLIKHTDSALIYTTRNPLYVMLLVGNARMVLNQNSGFVAMLVLRSTWKEDIKGYWVRNYAVWYESKCGCFLLKMNVLTGRRCSGTGTFYAMAV